MRILSDGDRGTALAQGRGRVSVTYRYRPLTLDSGVVVDDVLVGVDDATGDVLTIPAQSAPKIRRARTEAKEEIFSVRIPGQLDDVLWLASETLGTNPAKFAPAALRLYLGDAVRDEAVAARLRSLADSELAQGKARTKITLRAGRTLVADVGRVSKRQRATRSALVRGAIVALKEDLLDARNGRQSERLRAVARAL